MGRSYAIEFCGEEGQSTWPAVAAIYTKDVIMYSLFDGTQLSMVRDRIADIRAACDEMEDWMNEWGA